MKMKVAIRGRNNNRETPYYPAGKNKVIPSIGEFLSKLKLHNEEMEERKTYTLSAITADCVYYLDEQGDDDTTNTVILNRDMQLISDNFVGANDLIELVCSNRGLLWISKTVKDWQREQHTRPDCLTPAIRKALNQVDTDKLTDEEEAIYLAFRNNGPVKYKKAEALMAVLSNADCSTDNSAQMKAILNTLKLTNPSF